MADPVLRIRRGPSANLGITTLRLAEPGFTTDRYELFVGTGTTNKFLGAATYWTRETSSTGGGVNLLEATNNGSNYVTLAAPDSLAANVQYTFPETPVNNNFLKTNSAGVLSWDNPFVNLNADNATVGFLTVSQQSKFVGVATFADTTDSTTKDNGSVVFEGGIGIEKSVNIGGNLNVSGISTFVGQVTFKGGTINIGDQDTDDIFVGGEFASNLGPSTTNSYDIGSRTKSWRNIYIQSFNASGISTIHGFLYANDGLDVTGVTDVDDLRVSGVSTFTKNLDINGGVEIDGEVDLNSNFIVTGISTFNGPIDANNNLTVDGSVGFSSDFTVTGFSTFQNAVVMNSRLTVSSHTKLSSSLDVTGITTVGGFLDANNGADIFGHTELDSVNVSGISTLTTAYATSLTVTNPITGSISTATRANTVDTTNTTVDAPYYIIFADDSTSQTGETLRVSVGASFNPSTKTLTAENLRSSTLKAVDGTSAITISSQTGNVGVSSDLTVSGNLYVRGSTAEINAETLKVEDSLIEVGLINSGGALVPPSSDLNIDIGILMHWYNGSAKKAATFWDDSSQRIVIASDVSETSSIISVNTYAGLEIGNLWVNDTAGQSQVITYSAGERVLTNITIDGGSF